MPYSVPQSLLQKYLIAYNITFYQIENNRIIENLTYVSLGYASR